MCVCVCVHACVRVFIMLLISRFLVLQSDGHVGMHVRTYVYIYILHGMLGCIIVLPSSLILSSGTSCPVMTEKETSPPTPHGSLMKVGVVYSLREWEKRVCSSVHSVCRSLLPKSVCRAIEC